MENNAQDIEVKIESVKPDADGALKVTMVIPKENFEAQKHALELFFNQSTRDLSRNPNAQGPKKEAV